MTAWQFVHAHVSSVMQRRLVAVSHSLTGRLSDASHESPMDLILHPEMSNPAGKDEFSPHVRLHWAVTQCVVTFDPSPLLVTQWNLSGSWSAVHIHDAHQAGVQQAMLGSVQQLSSAWSDERAGPSYSHLYPLILI